MFNYMVNLRIAIIGLGRMGKFHAREFHNSGCDIVAVLCSNQENAKEACEMLKRDYEIDAKPYNNLSLLLKNEKVDAVSICTPHEMHGQNIKTCLDFGVHILCEKPLVLESFYENYFAAKNLFNLAREKGKILTMNAQLVSFLPQIVPEKFEKLSLYFEPGIKGKEMLFDHLPHANSLLLKLIPNGKMENISFPSIDDDYIKIKFSYSNQKTKNEIEYLFKFKKERPSNYSLSFDDKKFIRKIGENYQQKLVSENEEINIDDPLRISINKFVSAIKEEGNPLIEEKEVLESIKLQDEIIKKYFELKNYI